MARVAHYEYDIINDRYTYTSDTLYEILGLSKEEHPQFTSDLFWALVHPDDLDHVKKSVLRPGQVGSSTHEYRVIRPDGNVVYVNRLREVIRDECGQALRVVCTLQDITDRKMGELALQQSEERFRSLVQNGNELIGIIDVEGNYTYVEDNVRAQLGYSAADLVGRNAFEFIHPDDAGWVLNYLQENAAEHTFTAGPFRFKNASGDWRWVETTVTNHLLNKSIGGLVVNSKDVTEKVQIEAERKKNEEEWRKLSLIAQETSNPVIIQDKKRSVLWVNQAFIALSGYYFEECAGKFIGDIFDGPQTDFKTLRYVQEKIDRREPFMIEALHYKKNGETYWSEVSCQPIFDAAGEVEQYFSIATDITQRRKLEKQLEQEQRDRQIKISAATLKAQEAERAAVSQELHDNVNQVLTTVKLYTEMCRDGLSNTKEIMDKSINLLQDSINEIRSLSKRLSAPSLGKIKLAESVKELVDAVDATNKFEVTLTINGIEALDVQHDLHLAIYRILQEHMTNILKHAAASRVQVELDMILGLLILTVKDDGRGFDTSIKSNGIGITNMITRAESLQGSLQLKSSPGNGCVLRVSIPL
jgi:PAS domain S-box-containing protein